MHALPTLLLTFVLAQASGFDTDITVPPEAHPALQAKADGVQIYTCKAQGLSYDWVFKAPEAKLTDLSGQPLGTHAAGPVWTATDGSSIKGKVVAQKVAADPLSVPWLLLAATPDPATTGSMSRISFVRRSDTSGGVAPVDGCDASHVNTDIRVPYSATYTFYTADKAASDKK